MRAFGYLFLIFVLSRFLLTDTYLPYSYQVATKVWKLLEPFLLPVSTLSIDAQDTNEVQPSCRPLSAYPTAAWQEKLSENLWMQQTWNCLYSFSDDAVAWLKRKRDSRRGKLVIRDVYISTPNKININPKPQFPSPPLRIHPKYLHVPPPRLTAPQMPLPKQLSREERNEWEEIVEILKWREWGIVVSPQPAWYRPIKRYGRGRTWRPPIAAPRPGDRYYRPEKPPSIPPDKQSDNTTSSAGSPAATPAFDTDCSWVRSISAQINATNILITSGGGAPAPINAAWAIPNICHTPAYSCGCSVSTDLSCPRRHFYFKQQSQKVCIQLSIKWIGHQSFLIASRPSMVEFEQMVMLNPGCKWILGNDRGAETGRRDLCIDSSAASRDEGS